MASIQHDTDPEELFEVLERLGEGSYGKVYKALHRASADVVALKIVPCDGEDQDDAAASFERLTKEIRILESCQSPYIVQYYGSFLYDASLWISMEFCAAGSLADLLALRRRPLTEPQIAAVCANVALGLHYLHASQSIHRDIKAGNILLSSTGLAKLADFGVSAQLTSTMNKRKTVIGTPFWMAPEVIQESQYDGKADIWSLGITAIELAEGEPPLSKMHPMRAIFMIPTRPPPTLQHADAYSPEFNDFLAACLQKDAQQRPDAAQLLRHAFIKKHVDVLTAGNGSSGLPILQELVDESLEIVQEARDVNAQDEYAYRSSLTGRVDGSLSIADVSTMLRRGFGSLASTATLTSQSGTMMEVAGGTMVYCGSDTMREASGTLVYDTMRPSQPPPTPSVLHRGDSDTLVTTSTADPTDDGASRGSCTSTGTAEPSFMKYFREHHTAEDATTAKSATLRPASSSAVVDQVRAVHQQLKALDEQFERDQQALLKQYQAQRADLEQQLDDLAFI